MVKYTDLKHKTQGIFPVFYYEHFQTQKKMNQTPPYPPPSSYNQQVAAFA